MAKLTKIVEVLTVLGTIFVAVDKLTESKTVKVVSDKAMDKGKKLKDKVTRTDGAGQKKFKYNMDKILLLYDKGKISENVSDFLIKELENDKIFCRNAKLFEKLFASIIKAKGEDQIQKSISNYKKIRDKYFQ